MMTYGLAPDLPYIREIDRGILRLKETGIASKILKVSTNFNTYELEHY